MTDMKREAREWADNNTNEATDGWEAGKDGYLAGAKPRQEKLDKVQDWLNRHKAKLILTNEITDELSATLDAKE